MITNLHFTIFNFGKRFLICFSLNFLYLFLLLLLRFSQIVWQLILAFIALKDSLYFITFFISSFLIQLLNWFFIFPKLKSFVKTNNHISMFVWKKNSLSIGNTFRITENAIVVPLPHVYVHWSWFWRLNDQFRRNVLRLLGNWIFVFVSGCCTLNFL